MTLVAPGTVADSYAEVSGLRSDAATARGRAEEARALALEIDIRRHTVLERDDDCVARHTADVWSSRAAEISRISLVRGVGYALWTVSVGLQETMRDLEAAASDLEDDAGWSLRRADQLEQELAARPPVS